MGGPLVRDARMDDAAACAALYREYVLVSAATFETEPPSTAEVAGRIAACQESHAYLVAEDGGRVVGFAYGTRFAERPAYRWTAESSVYLDPAAAGRNAGSALYAALLPRLADRGFHVVLAKIAQPNDASNALHARFGFERVGLLRRVGFKLGSWHDVALLQLDLVPTGSLPAEPT